MAGLLRPADLAGYRSAPVFIRRSMHVPPGSEAVRDAMPVLFEMLREESEPSVRMVLGHFIFVYIHPYSDGNGRIGRFLMNVMLALEHARLAKTESVMPGALTPVARDDRPRYRGRHRGWTVRAGAPRCRPSGGGGSPGWAGASEAGRRHAHGPASRTPWADDYVVELRDRGVQHAQLVVVPPQVAIVGVGRLTRQVIAVGDTPTIHRQLPLSLTFDHRAVTGAEAARFLRAVIADLEKSE